MKEKRLKKVNYNVYKVGDMESLFVAKEMTCWYIKSEKRPSISSVGH